MSENDDRVLPVDAERAAQAPAAPRAAAGPRSCRRAASVAAAFSGVRSFWAADAANLAALRSLNSADDPAGFEVRREAPSRLVLRRARPGPALRRLRFRLRPRWWRGGLGGRGLLAAGDPVPQRPDRGGHPPRDEGRERRQVAQALATDTHGGAAQIDR